MRKTSRARMKQKFAAENVCQQCARKISSGRTLREKKREKVFEKAPNTKMDSISPLKQDSRCYRARNKSRTQKFSASDVCQNYLRGELCKQTGESLRERTRYRKGQHFPQETDPTATGPENQSSHPKYVC